MKNPKLTTLIETIESLHSLTVWYSSLLKDTEVLKNFIINDVKINNLYWLTAHIANSESLLLLTALGGKGHQYKWLKEFKLGSEKDIETNIPYKKLVEIAKEIHSNSISYLHTLQDKDLEKNNILEFEIGGKKSFKSVIMHHIRHQGIHTGHLSTLCSFNRIKTI